MPIEFRCTQCGKLLRTGDDTAGKRAKCPQCGTMLAIPAPDAAPPGGSMPPPHPTFAPAPGYPAPGASPYQASSAAPGAGAAAMGGLRTTPIDMNDILSRTWAIFKSQIGMCIVLPLIVNLIAGFAFALIWAVTFAIAAILGSPAIFKVLLFFGVIAVLLVFLSLVCGQVRAFLKIARGQPVAIGELFAFGPHIIPFVIIAILVGLMEVVGGAMCVAPGIILGCMFSQAIYLVLDRKEGVIDSLSHSKDITTGSKLSIFLIWLVSALGAGLFSLVTCGFGGLVSFPFLQLMWCVVYLTITGQPAVINRQQVAGG
jgi:phage FluMu protein Com